MPEALLIIDVQNDFLPGGALAVPDGDEVIAPINALAADPRFAVVIATRDWHPPDHQSFAEQGGPWPAHCVQGTSGAELTDRLNREAIDAVIDKDYVSVMLATDAQCDALAILTGVEKVAINFNTPDQRDLDEITVADAEKYMAEGQFPEGSMLPKIRAALRFTTSGPGRRTLITSLDKLVEGLKGQTGTWIVP